MGCRRPQRSPRERGDLCLARAAELAHHADALDEFGLSDQCPSFRLHLAGEAVDVG